MNNIIGISTGAVIWEEAINDKIAVLKKAEIKAVEVLFRKTIDLDEKISSENISYLKQLDYLSIHAPFLNEKHRVFYKNDFFLKKIQQIYAFLNAKAVVFHPNLISNWDIFENIEMNACMENMPKRRGFFIEEALKRFRMVLDTAHALTYGQDFLDKLISEFKGRIQHIHFSDRRYSEYFKRVRDHEQFLFCKDIEKFQEVKDLNCPIIIEASIRDFLNLKKEVVCVDNFFNS